ncbi:toxin [Corynebacterium macginleyi]|uniref:Toxin n=1 Tax=Corynebacterium macginleyi TaxID=38290 RepID=A0A3M0GGC1_9CORY|nr:toxin [Corynebacterium macginleyi]RMB63577.1 toxin [Corynebacterium macginleyi]
MKAAKSATKHGIAEADGIHAASYPLWIEPLDDNPGQWRELRLGFDTHARLLETVVVVASDGDGPDPLLVDT